MSDPPARPGLPRRPHKPGRNRWVILCIALLLIVFVVVTEAASSHTKKSTAASSPGPSPIAAAASHSVPQASSKPRITRSTVTGYGATIAAWNAHHTADHDFAAGTVYDPDPSLPGINGHTGAVYVLVTSQDGLILSYAMNLPTGTTLHAAITTAQAEFPHDARLLWVAHKNSCVQAQFASRILGHVLARPAIGDAFGQVLVEFEDLSASGADVTSPHMFNSASFDLGEATTPAGSPRC